MPYPDDNPKTIYGVVKPPMSLTPIVALKFLGLVMRHGAQKYGRFNWRNHRVSSTIYYDAAMRHMMAWMEGEDLDPESGQPHLAHVMACCAIILDATDRGNANDDRLMTGDVRDPEPPT